MNSSGGLADTGALMPREMKGEVSFHVGRSLLSTDYDYEPSAINNISTSQNSSDEILELCTRLGLLNQTQAIK